MNAISLCPHLKQENKMPSSCRYRKKQKFRLEMWCKDCRKEYYVINKEYESWNGYPGGIEGNLLGYITGHLKHRNYVLKDIAHVVVKGECFRWNCKVFDFYFYGRDGATPILQIDRIVMNDGSFFYTECGDGEYTLDRLSFQKYITPTSQLRTDLHKIITQKINRYGFFNNDSSGDNNEE